MKGKILNITIVLASLIGYLEWGKDNHAFLFEAETEILSKLFTAPGEVIHPLTLLPLFGQLLLILSLFQKRPGKLVSIFGISFISILLLLMFIIGLLTLNFKVLISTIPFILTAVFTLRYYLKNPLRTQQQ